MQLQNKYRILIGFFLATGIVLLLIVNSCMEDGNPSGPFADIHSKTRSLEKKTKSEKLDNPALFAKYHHLIRTRIGESEPRYESGYRWKEYRKSISKRQNSLTDNTLEWVERGPGNVGGRTRSIWVDPTDSTHLTWFAGSVSGGIWKTENGGVSWLYLTEDLSNLATSTITGSAANPNILYVGTGEGYNVRWGVAGNGIWKSTDKGKSWFPLDSTLNNPKFGYTMRIVVNSDDENEIVVASRLGRVQGLNPGAPRSFLHKSTDGGQTWLETWQDSLIVQQVVAHPGSFDTLFAAVNSGGILRSFDAGLSWHLALDVDSTNMERIELAVSPTDPNYLYFAAFAWNTWGWPQSLLFRSADGGDSWSEVKGKNQQNDFGNWMGAQGWYNNTIAVHPFDPHTVFVGGQGAILKITVLYLDPVNPDGTINAMMEPVADGYSQYTQFNTSTKGVHVDHHSLILIPIDKSTGQFYILNANDGGVAFSTDSGNTFTQTGDTFNPDSLYTTFLGYNTSQFYGVDKMNGADRYVGGTQDNSIWVSKADPDSSSKWVVGPTGDGFEVAWHYEDTDTMLGSIQFGSLFRSNDGGENWHDVSPPRENIFEVPFMTRIANSKIDPDMVFCVTKSGVARSFDFADSWEIIPMPDEWQYSPFTNIIRTSLASHLVVWTGLALSENNRMLVSVNGGSTFSATNFYDQAELGLLSGLATHPHNEKTAYALFSAADAPKILRTTDMGAHWEDISGFVTNVSESNNGFPDVAVYSLLVMPFDTNQIWVGTEIGLFESLDNGLSWQYADNGLPPVSIWEMKIVNDEVVLATHGRGIWTVALPELSGYEPPQPFALISLLELHENGLGGRINGSYHLRSDYDSVFIEAVAPINDSQSVSVRFQLESNQVMEEGDFHLILEGLSRDTIYNAYVSLVGYRAGLEVRNIKQTLVFGVSDETRIVYANDFDNVPGDFARLDFNIYQDQGFASKALHSRHPYLGFHQTYLAVLNFPIIVTTGSLISFDEIAMIEPGAPGSVFGDTLFWDFVAVEGTRDLGQSWEVIEGYDSRWSNAWVTNYVKGEGPVDTALMETHTMDLTSIFDPGDTIFLRLRLQSDPYEEGWGWVIDNLNIQGNPTGNNDIDLPERIEISAFPNPAGSFINLSYKLPEKQAVKIGLYSNSGQFLSTLEEGIKPAGENKTSFNANRLGRGLYFFRFQTGAEVRVIKWVKL